MNYAAKTKSICAAIDADLHTALEEQCRSISYYKNAKYGMADFFREAIASLKITNAGRIAAYVRETAEEAQKAQGL